MSYHCWYTLCSEKHPLTVSVISQCVDLDKNCSQHTKGTVDANNVEIKYSLRPMK